MGGRHRLVKKLLFNVLKLSSLLLKLDPDPLESFIYGFLGNQNILKSMFCK